MKLKVLIWMAASTLCFCFPLKTCNAASTPVNTENPSEQKDLKGNVPDSTIGEAAGTEGGTAGEEGTVNVMPQIPKVPDFSGMVRPVKPIQGANNPHISLASKANALKSPIASPQVLKASIPGSAMNSQNLGNDSSVAKLQDQIQEMLRTNEGLKMRYKEQAADIQKIMDQARIHRDILKGLEEGKPLAQKPVELLDANEILRQEKIRLIRDQVAQNQAFLNGLKDVRAEQQQTKASEEHKTKS